MNEFFTGIILIFLGGVVSIFVPERFKGILISIFLGAGTISLLIPTISVLFGNQVFSFAIFLPYPMGETRFLIDPLSAFFIFLISIMSFIATLYSMGYLRPYIGENASFGSHLFFLALLIIAMLLVATVHNALAFLIAWEIMSLSSFFLVAFENEKEEVISASINYLIMMHIGVVFLTAGFVYLSIKSGSLDFASFMDILQSDRRLANILFLTSFIGFGIKAGFIPFHTWLPRAHPAAPSHISGLMSGVMIKTGIYGILRVITLIGRPSPEISYLVLVIAISSGIFGIVYAVAQKDFKRLLAYSSIENIGIIGIGISVGMLGLAYENNLLSLFGFSGAMLHILNHSILKGLLFYGAGSVYQKTHTRDIERLGGIIKKMPYTGFFFLIGSLAIIGLPPFNGFISEFLIYTGMLNALKIETPFISLVSILSIASLALIGAIALICFTRVFAIIFLGSPRSRLASDAKEIGGIMLFPMGILVMFSVLIGIFPQYIFSLIEKPILSLTKMHQMPYIHLLDILANISIASIVFIGIFILIYGLRSLLLKNQSVYKYKTWDCGYQAGNSRMQYTGASYASPFLALVKPIIKLEIKRISPEGLFPRHAGFESSSRSIFEFYLINPISTLIKNLLALFAEMQTGSTQHYILYSLIFLIAVLTWIMVAG